FGSDVQPRLLRRLDPSELRKHAFTGESPILDCHRRPFSTPTNAPAIVFQDVFGRIRKGSNLDPTLHAERSRNLPERDDAIVRPLVASRLGNARRLVAQVKIPDAHKALRAPCETMLCGCCGSLLSVLLDEALDALGNGRTLAQPVVDAIELQFELALLSLRNRVVEAHLLQDRPSLTFAAVGNHDVVKGLLFRPAAGEPNRNHADKASNSLRNTGSPEGHPPEKGADLTQK